MMTATDSTRAILIAVRSLLLGDTDFLALCNQVFSHAPQGTQGVWVTIGDISYQDFSTSDTDGQEFNIDVNVWAQSTSRTQETAKVQNIMAVIRKLLHFTKLNITVPHHDILMHVVNSTPVMLDPDETTLHGVVSVRVLSENV
jgi:hypothetical protein